MLESAAHIAIVVYVVATLGEFARAHYVRARANKRLRLILGTTPDDNSELN